MHGMENVKSLFNVRITQRTYIHSVAKNEFLNVEGYCTCMYHWHLHGKMAKEFKFEINNIGVFCPKSRDNA
jgi:hypothetical protein